MCPNYCNGHVFIYNLKEEQKERIGRWAKQGILCKMILPYPKEVREDLKIEQEYNKEEQRLRERGRNEIEHKKLQEKYPHKQLWYNWRCANRGSKWGLCECVVHNNYFNLELNFWTARSPVIPVFKELSRKYKCTVEYDYDEPGNCFSGRIKWENGVEVYDDRFDDGYYGEGVECSRCHCTYDGTNEEDWSDMENHICFNCGEEENEEH